MSGIVLIHRRTHGLLRVGITHTDTDTNTNTPVLESVSPPSCGSCHAFNAGRCLKDRAAVKPAETGCADHRWFPTFVELMAAAETLALSKNQSALEAMTEDFSVADENHVSLLELLESGDKPQPELSAPVTNSPTIKWVTPMALGAIIDSPKWISADAGQRAIETPRPLLRKA